MAGVNWRVSRVAPARSAASACAASRNDSSSVFSTVRKRRELKEGSVQSVFPGVPKILQKPASLPRNTKRTAPSVCQEQLKLEAHQMEKDRIKKLKVIDLADLTLKLSECHIPSEFPNILISIRERIIETKSYIFNRMSLIWVVPVFSAAWWLIKFSGLNVLLIVFMCPINTSSICTLL